MRIEVQFYRNGDNGISSPTTDALLRVAWRTSSRLVVPASCPPLSFFLRLCCAQCTNEIRPREGGREGGREVEDCSGVRTISYGWAGGQTWGPTLSVFLLLPVLVLQQKHVFGRNMTFWQKETVSAKLDIFQIFLNLIFWRKKMISFGQILPIRRKQFILAEKSDSAKIWLFRRLYFGLVSLLKICFGCPLLAKTSDTWKEEKEERAKGRMGKNYRLGESTRENTGATH